jgi:predicted Fe-S protein YdhL (DUF1289 family)
VDFLQDNGLANSTVQVVCILVFIMQKKDTHRPDTPCVAVCSTTFDEVCRGCGRTAWEVAQWVTMTQEEKDIVWERITVQGYPRRNG